ncbi:hypothetical protein TREMEDRAFT_59215 [Tremella mesenterica DSM 1558]|uniref:uncharacterized protein n=1 Tax=Tremella mesenterica (strain ATCC 24925 / CBS 8224 / DSM 1558 / NBRC 9311 / NRRL Y-6157 / RJB 2259-6 / UBC 559-6) TaxID=578456 RepID=UPI0003F49C42|nr:uncharacterized protein TREMEDRAFT_59215 [Tremella mesenterica DSM 1558]EIW73052.1 hypothetical protein TREMEDRAFT_59215 [Tremella mesenterica DSM 1558]
MRLPVVLLTLLSLGSVNGVTTPNYKQVIGKSDCVDIDTFKRAFNIVCPNLSADRNIYVGHKSYFQAGDFSGLFKDTHAVAYCHVPCLANGEIYEKSDGTYDDKTPQVCELLGGGVIIYD